jgi:quercetin dioxygenase-like cupin family protein
MRAGGVHLGDLAAAALVPLIPPPALRDRILAARRTPPFTFLHREQGIWLPSPDAPVAAKVLFAPSSDDAFTRLVRVSGGEDLPPAALAGRRTILVVTGEFRCGDASLGALDLVEEAVTGGTGDPRWRATRDSLAVEFSETTAGASRRFARAPEARWTGLMPGIAMRPLAGEPNGPRQIYVLQAEPGVELVEHAHGGTEELYVLEGSCLIEQTEMRLGDYHRAATGSAHRATLSGRDGCRLLVSVRTIGGGDRAAA